MWRWFLCCCGLALLAPPAPAQFRAAEPGQTRITTAQPGDRWVLLPLRYLRAEDAAAMYGFKADGSALATDRRPVFELPDGVRRLTAHPLLNAIAALGDRESTQELRELLCLLDQPVQRIAYQVTAVNLAEVELDKLGLSWVSPTKVASYSYHLELGQGDLALARTKLEAVEPRYRCQAPQVIGDNGQPVVCRLNNGPQSAYAAPMLGLALVGRVTGEPPTTSVTTIVHGCQFAVPATPRESGEPDYRLVSVADTMVRIVPGGVAVLRLAGPLRDGRHVVLMISTSILPPLT